jgi:serine/threonine protein kinase
MQAMAELELPSNPRYEIVDIFFEEEKTLAGMAYDHQIGDKVFIKTKAADLRDARSRMEREADLLASLSHPQIPHVVDVDTNGAAPYIVTEFKRDSPYIRARLVEGLPAKLAVQLCISALEPLEYVHQQGIIHRDIKTKNILMHDLHGATLVDFELGLCKDTPTAKRVYVTAGDTHTHITNLGTVVGTTKYIAPEQARGHRPTLQSDIYAAGIVLFELLYGRVPFEAENGRAECMRHIKDEINFDDPERNIPEGLVRIIDRATQKSPDRRFESAAAMSEELQRYLAAA